MLRLSYEKLKNGKKGKKKEKIYKCIDMKRKKGKNV